MPQGALAVKDFLAVAALVGSGEKGDKDGSSKEWHWALLVIASDSLLARGSGPRMVGMVVVVVKMVGGGGGTCVVRFLGMRPSSSIISARWSACVCVCPYVRVSLCPCIRVSVCCRR